MGFLFPRMIKEVQVRIGNKCLKLNALVDTGSELTALKESIFEQCGESLTPTGMSMNGLGKKIVESLGTFESEIVIDDVKLCSKCYVLPDSAFNFDMILGLDVIMQAKLEVSRSGVKIIPTVVENNFEEVNEEISCLNNIELLQEDELDLRHVNDKKIQKRLIELIEDYKPMKDVIAPVEMEIVLQFLVVRESYPFLKRKKCSSKSKSG